MYNIPSMTAAGAHEIFGETGISPRSIITILKEYERTKTVSSPRRNRSKRSAFDRLDTLGKEAIRRKVHSFFRRREIPNIDKILEEVNGDETLPNFCRTTMYNMLRELGFRFRKRERQSILLERDDIVLWRRDYIRKIRQYQSENRPIYYTDETWIEK